jgi:hypothetical protein
LIRQEFVRILVLCTAIVRLLPSFARKRGSIGFGRLVENGFPLARE